MKKIVECVPNFSEGRRKETIDAISAAIRGVDGAALLDVEPGASTNRTVYTFVGTPEVVVTAALAAAHAAWEHIDMTRQTGAHPRLGALDVCPFVPVQHVTVEECVEISKTFGARLAAELGVPVYLYGEASHTDYRKSMPQIRAGEYEGLEEKLTKPEWRPDFGEARFVPRWGATVTGVRKFLIAYNVNVLGTKEQAHRLALNIREQGRSKDQPGRLKNCQAIGWYLDERKMAQVSINLTDYDVTPIHVAYEEVRKDSEELRVAVAGSEIVGLVPLQAMLQAGEYYIQKEGLMILEEEQKVYLAVQRLGLNALGTFNPREKIIEYMVSYMNEDLGLTGLSLKEFVKSVGARSAAPGGGSVAATVGALGAGLGTMVGLMSYGKKQFDPVDSTVRRWLPVLHRVTEECTSLIDADSDAFNRYMAACRLPRDTPDQSQARELAVERALKNAVDVPLRLARVADQAWSAMIELAAVANINTKSDLQVGARCVETAIWGANYNVMINLEAVKDSEFKERVVAEISRLVERAGRERELVLGALDRRSN